MNLSENFTVGKHFGTEYCVKNQKDWFSTFIGICLFRDRSKKPFPAGDVDVRVAMMGCYATANRILWLSEATPPHPNKQFIVTFFPEYTDLFGVLEDTKNQSK